MTKILIADQDRDYRELVIFTMRFAGYDMYAASNSGECLVEARQHQPDLILLELDLPDKGGMETCARLRSDPATVAIPVIFLTKPDQVYWKDDSKQACTTESINKSLSPDKLVTSVNRFFSKLSKSKHI